MRYLALVTLVTVALAACQNEPVRPKQASSPRSVPSMTADLAPGCNQSGDNEGDYRCVGQGNQDQPDLPGKKLPDVQKVREAAGQAQ